MPTLPHYTVHIGDLKLTIELPEQPIHFWITFPDGREINFRHPDHKPVDIGGLHDAHDHPAKRYGQLKKMSVCCK